MKRIIVIALSVLLFLVSACPALAATSQDKVDKYNAAITQLETYLDNQQEDIEQLTDIYNNFKSLKGYEKCAEFSCYVHILMFVAEGDYDSFELAFELDKLQKFNGFASYLKKDLSGSSIGTLTDLLNYFNGRKAEAAGSDTAAGYYEACLSYFDTDQRYTELYNSAAAAHYEKAMELFLAGQLEKAYREFDLAGRYEDSKTRMEFIVTKLGYSPDHEHSWDKGKLIKANCTESGIKTFTCTICGATKQETVAAVGKHTWINGTVTKQATCTENGIKTWTCSICGKIGTDTIKATGKHSWDSGTVTRKATCGSDGLKTFKCTKCGKTYTEKIAAAGKHNWQKTTAYAPMTCKNCGQDIVTFGSYPQSSSGSRSPIEWYVLDISGDRALLLSKYGLDAMRYYAQKKTTSWYLSEIREWLNNSFYYAAFSVSEQRSILTTTIDNSKSQTTKDWLLDPSIKTGPNTDDKVFLLSYKEAERYFNISNNSGAKAAIMIPTAYAKAHGAETNGQAGVWWLRSIGENKMACAAYVSFDGRIRSRYVNDENKTCVRPAIRVNISSGILDK